jgi:hypothetical protein
MDRERRVIEAGEYVRDRYDFLYSADNQNFVTIVGVDLDGKRSARIGGNLAAMLHLLAGEIIAQQAGKI